MTEFPRAGWFPDPEAGYRWRWWDGRQWAPPGYGYAAAAPIGAVRNSGRWQRFAFVANAVGMMLTLIGIAVGFRGGFHFPPLDAGGNSDFPRSWMVMEVLWFPANIVRMGSMVLLILWMYQAGKVADLEGWPRARDRALGALSVLIPIVNLWWPYEAIRDLFPPGARPAFLLRWWVSHFVVPIVAFVAVFLTTIGGSLAVCCAVTFASAVMLLYPAVLGWRLVDALDDVHRRVAAN